MQVMTTVSPRLEALKKEGEAGRKTINQYTRYLTVGLAVVQSCGDRARSGDRQAGLIINPGICLRDHDRGHADRRRHVPDVAGRADHLARHRQRRLADHLRRHRRQSAARLRRHDGDGAHRRDHGWFSAIGALRAGRRASSPSSSSSSARSDGCLVQYPKRQIGNRMFGGDSSHLAAEAQHLGRHPADLRLVAAGPAADGRAVQRREHRRNGCREVVRLHAARHAALHAPLRRADRLLRLLLHRRRLQPERHGRQSEEVRRLHPGHPARQEDGRVHRLRADAPDRRSARSISSLRVSRARVHPGAVRRQPAAPRRHLVPDHRQR